MVYVDLVKIDLELYVTLMVKNDLEVYIFIWW